MPHGKDKMKSGTKDLTLKTAGKRISARQKKLDAAMNKAQKRKKRK